jgi:ketosteroid isomerase-like protein
MIDIQKLINYIHSSIQSLIYQPYKEAPMHRLISLFLIPVLFGLITGCAEAPPDRAVMVSAADELDQKFFDAYNNKDLETIKELYWNSPDLVSHPPGEMELKGYDAVIESFKKDFDRGMDSKLEVIEITNRAEGNIVVGTGTWRFTLNMPESEPVVIEGRYLDVKAEHDGKWVYVADHASVPLPPPPETEGN